MKRQQWGKRSIGSIIGIKIDNYFCFAQLITEDFIAFFDYRSTVNKFIAKEIEKARTLFILCVHETGVVTGRWEKIGKLPLREDFKTLPYQFIHDSLKPADRGYELYNLNTGKITPCTVEETKGLERCAIWEYNHVEDRLRCHYEGKPCVWVEQMYEDTIWNTTN